MIAWYVHHHGRGHLHRALTIAARLRTPVVGLSSLPAPPGWSGEWVELADDADGVPDPVAADVTAGSTLHWVPRRHPGLRARTAALSQVLARPEVDLAVVDVSVEAAVLARLHGVPTVVLTQPGRRTDRPHRTAHDLAEIVLAPWPDVGAPGSATVVHVGALSRFDGRAPELPDERPGGPGERSVLVVWGSGGLDVGAAEVAAAAAATPGWRWSVLGPPPPADPGPVTWRGWCDDPWPSLHAADVVITHAGLNALAELAAARRPAVVLPQDRPFGEQHATAALLRERDVVSTVWPWPVPAAWPALLDAAAARGGAGWARWSDGRGAHRAAALLDDLVAR